jgi:HEPN domain-containing protein
MSEPDFVIEAKRWLQYAQEDLNAAELILKHPTIAHRHVCWLAQQCADLAELTEWAVESRYPGDWQEANEHDAQLAFKQARDVLESIRVDLKNQGMS